MSSEEKTTDFRFEIGQVVHHKRYDYRGVIYDRDSVCLADEEWYQKNQTQPKRDQPWYHVLVHNALHTTYVAESNLEPDSTRQPIRHPLLQQFFKGFLKGRYYVHDLN